jgi:putative iron-dependent peroxidase
MLANEFNIQGLSGDDVIRSRTEYGYNRLSIKEKNALFDAIKTSTFNTVQKMLNNMFIGSPEGNYDRILDFSTPKTGSLYFVPTFNRIDDFSSD